MPARLGERGAIVYGIVINGLVFVFLSLVWNGWVAFASTTVTALGAVVNPVLQARMNRIAQDNQPGELQGVVSPVRPFVRWRLYFHHCANRHLAIRETRQDR